MIKRLEREGQERFFGYMFAVLLCCILPTNIWAEDIQIRAELDPVQLIQGQAARFVVTVVGARSAKPEMPVAEGFHFIYQGQSSQASWVNGTISSSVSYTFNVYADKAGDFTIAPVKVAVQGKTYSSEPVQCTVLPAQNSGQAATSPSGQGNIPDATPTTDEGQGVGFLRIIPDSQRIYSGQVVPFVLKAYFHPGRQITLKSAPRLSGEDFLLQSLDEEPLQRKERLNGISYIALTWQGTLSAVKEGSFPLIVEMDAEVLVRSRSRRNPFGSSLLDDPFFSDILGNYSRREIRLTSQEKGITVLDLPAENRPDDFSGAIGSFSLAVAASPLDGKVGDPITVKIQLEGTGNFALVQAPVLTDKTGWKVYPASGTVQDLGAGKGMKTFEQALIPMEQGLTVVPPRRFSYFDPQNEEYMTLTSDPIPLYLQAGDQQSLDQTSAQDKKNQVQTTLPEQQNRQGQQKGEQPAGGKIAGTHQHLAPLHPELGKLVPALQPLYQKFWFQLLMVLALLCLLFAVVLYLKQRMLARDPGILRRKKVQACLAVHYEEMDKALAIPDQETFQQHCRAAIQQRAGEAWELAPEAVTLADLEQRLPADAPLRAVFSRLEQSGYAGEQLSQDALQEILHITKNELDKLG
jgi:hypothetical protein